MDSVFKYPLFKAHSLQRQAEEKEIKGDINSALKLREESLENLKAALSLTSSEVILRNIELQIKYEQQLLQNLRNQKEENEQLMNNIKETLQKKQKDGNKKEEKSEQIEIIKAMEELLNRAEMKLNTINEKNNESKEPLNSLLEPSILFQKHFEEVKPVRDHTSNPHEEVLALISNLKDKNNRCFQLTTKFLKDYIIMQSENDKLKLRVKELEEKLKIPSRDIHDLMNPGFVCTPIYEKCESNPLSFEELVPLESPSLDFH